MIAYPMTTAEMKVPANANAKMTPKFRKKLACLSSKPELRMIGGSRTFRRMVFSAVYRKSAVFAIESSIALAKRTKGYHRLHNCSRCEPDYQSYQAASAKRDDSLVYRLDPPNLEVVGYPEGENEKAQDKKYCEAKIVSNGVSRPRALFFGKRP